MTRSVSPPTLSQKSILNQEFKKDGEDNNHFASRKLSKMIKKLGHIKQKNQDVLSPKSFYINIK